MPQLQDAEFVLTAPRQLACEAIQVPPFGPVEVGTQGGLHISLAPYRSRLLSLGPE